MEQHQLPVSLVMAVQLNIAVKHGDKWNDDSHDKSVVTVVNFRISWVLSEISVSKVYCCVIDV